MREPKGSVQVLCDEIGFTFDPRLERPDVLTAFVGVLVAEVADMREMAVRIAPYTGKQPSAASGEVLALAEAMLSNPCEASAAAVHDACHQLNPDEKVPTDHIIDMLSSCASGIRFGLATDKWGVGSRHAASAADHIWRQKYGVSLFDRHSPAWGKEWARSVLMSAIFGLLPATPATPNLSGPQGTEAALSATDEPVSPPPPAGGVK